MEGSRSVEGTREAGDRNHRITFAKRCSVPEATAEEGWLGR